MPEKAVLPQTHLIRYAPKAQGTWSVLPELVAFRDPLNHPNLLNKTKIRQVYYCSSLYICHTKAMITLVEYGIRCLHENTHFYSVLILRSASWLKLKVLIFGNDAKRTFICVSRLCRSTWKYFQLQQNCLYDV